MHTSRHLLQDSFDAAAALIAEADGLLLTAGAGIGIDSGLPDFRGDRGFWKAYPALGELDLRFHEIANPQAFRDRPETAWGFYGHRLNLYRTTQPHAGFGYLRNLAAKIPNGAFVFTSNVDGQFQKAGFDPGRVAECHGSIHHLQCLDGCGQTIWQADNFAPLVDEQHCRLQSSLPRCPACGALARPNIMMFGDWDWDDRLANRQHARLEAWLARVQRPVVIEIGAGTAIPTVRHFGEGMDCPLIRINPTEVAVGLRRDISLPTGALEGMRGIAETWGRLQ